MRDNLVKQISRRQTGGHVPKPVTGMPGDAFDTRTNFHRDLGNTMVSRITPVQPRAQAKLRVGDPDDVYEREADRMAERITRMSVSSQPINDVSGANLKVQRKCETCEREEEEVLQRKPIADNSAAPEVSFAGSPASSNGRPLNAATRGFFETRFGHSFEHVRVHDDESANQSARTLRARAYTVGNHISFARGEFRPDSTEGRKLLAHELTHTIQQSGTAATIQRVCDPVLLAGRTSPAYFPHETTLLDVYRGASTLTRSRTRSDAVGLVQQALVDLGYNIGATGPNGDGVDRRFGRNTRAGVSAFQTAEGIAAATAGVVDEPTLKCLDDKRSRLNVQPQQAGTVTATDVRIGGRESGGRDEDIFFARGSSILNAANRAKIGRLLTRAAFPLKGCAITLEGFISEDELVDFGPSLATDRINAVDAEFISRRHDDPGPTCPLPVLPLRTHSPLPAASSGVSDYRSRRKVEIVPVGATSTTTPCPPGSPQFRSLSAVESNILTDAIDQGVIWLNAAIAKLTPGDPDGDAALNAYFGGTGRRSTVRTNLITWRDHLDVVVRANNRHGTQCNAVCRTATAFNNGTGAAAQMTVCPPFFQPISAHAALNQDEKKAFVVVHEAGHGSIGTDDIGYGHRRLIEFLAGYPTLAESNTDSYTLMVLCLNGFAGFCSAPVPTDTTAGLSGAEEIKVRQGLAWLQTWLTWAQQDTSSLYRRMNIGRESGQGLRALNSFYAGVFDTLASAFNIRRPAGDPPPTFSEQTMVAAILDRLLPMQRATAAGLTVEKDTSATPTARWAFGPGRHVFLTDRYFLLTTDRARVENLLPLILRANALISVALEPVYETYIKENVRNNRGNQP